MKKTKKNEGETAMAPIDVRPLIHEIRGVQVMLDRDLAAIYHVMTGRLNEAVKRNIERFPSDFMFQLDGEEMDELIANCDRFRTMKHSPSRMYAFTEQGVAMLSAVLKSDIAVRESIRIMKAFDQSETDGEFASLAVYLPGELVKVPRARLCLREPTKRFEVLLSATLQKTFIVEADDEESAERILEERWLTGHGGAIRHDDLECVGVQFDVVGRDVE